MLDMAPDRIGPDPDEAGFRAWLAARTPALRRKAFLLSGDWHAADDLVQDTLVAMYAGWSRIARGRNVDAYASRVLVHKYLDQQRRPWRRERPVAAVPDSVDDASGRALAGIENRDDLLTAALAALPAGQRAVLVLRYTDDLSLEQIAHLLDLPVGTVKSRLSRGSDAARADLARRGHPMASTPTASTSPRPGGPS